MKYDFTSILDRKGHDAIALDAVGLGGMAPGAPKEGFDVIPMWVADMNFPLAPSIKKAILERMNYETYGYFAPSNQYYDSIINWQIERNSCDPALLTKETIGYENGVLGGVVSALRALAFPGDAVLVHSPTYIGFTHCLNDNGYKIVHSPLIKDHEGVWRMDYEDMDRKLKENNCHAAIFCNPHNPCGRVWEEWEIKKAMDVYQANNVIVISDEIWSDLMINGHKHTPAQSVSEDARNRTIAFYAPSKTFNLAGLVGSYHIIYNQYLRDRVRASSSKTHYNQMNVLSMHALIGAYSQEGSEWVQELNTVLTDNINYACDYIEKNFKGISVYRSQGTYMLFWDCTKWCADHQLTIDDLEKACWDVGVAVQDGRMFQHPCAIRMNLALPTSRVKEAFERLQKYVFC